MNLSWNLLKFKQFHWKFFCWFTMLVHIICVKLIVGSPWMLVNTHPQELFWQVITADMGLLPDKQKLGFEHALETFSPPSLVIDPDMHHGMCVTHVTWCMPGSLNSSFHWKLLTGKTFLVCPSHAQPIILRIWQGWVSDSLKPVYDKMRHKLS